MTQRHCDSSDSSKAIHMCSQKFMGVPQRLKPTDEHVLNKLLIVAKANPSAQPVTHNVIFAIRSIAGPTPAIRFPRL